MSDHDIDARKPWFRAKRFGWGWSWPLTWQGWLVFGMYAVLVTGGVHLFAAKEDAATLGAYVLLLTGVLIAICWRTGERPRWRWGDRD
jgi:hypothetical protein